MAGGQLTSKEFKDAVANILRESFDMEFIVPQGSCVNCGTPGNRYWCCLRNFCPDIYAIHRSSTFVLDCETYGANTYLHREKVMKTIRDQQETNSDVSVFVLGQGRVTRENRQYFEEMGIRLVQVDTTHPNWSTNLVNMFQACFQEG